MTGVPFTDGRERAGAEVIDFDDARNERFAIRLVKLLRSHGYTDAQIERAAQRVRTKLCAED